MVPLFAFFTVIVLSPNRLCNAHLSPGNRLSFGLFTTEITELLAPGKIRLIAFEFWACSHDHLDQRPEWSFAGLGPAIALVTAET